MDLVKDNFVLYGSVKTFYVCSCVFCLNQFFVVWFWCSHSLFVRVVLVEDNFFVVLV